MVVFLQILRSSVGLADHRESWHQRDSTRFDFSVPYPVQLYEWKTGNSFHHKGAGLPVM